ncbi:MAG: Sensor protein FixL [Phycisphaerae bacterium]|nr:Sensor protein FixL [Phycisphaerae bacterium]
MSSHGPSSQSLHTSDDVQRSIEDVQQQLFSLHRHALLGSMVLMVAHEFRNLLTPVLGGCQNALASDDPVLMKKVLQRTVVQSQRATEICAHLLALARDTTKPGPNDVCVVADALQDAIASVASPFEKVGIELVIDVDAALRVRGQPTMLHQVLLNLLLNARKAMEKSRGILTVRARPDDEMVRIEVKDTGVGIPQDRLENLFNPFLASPPGEELRDWSQIGIGLAVCRRLVHENGGTIEVRANDGVGCTVLIRWPAA